MTGYSPDSLDEIVYSALFEISNIIGGTVCQQLANTGTAYDISPPIMSTVSINAKIDWLVLDTSMGLIKISCEAD